MAGETIKSNIITALDAGYASLLASTRSYGKLFSQTAIIEVTAETQLEATDKLQMLRIPSSASIVSLKLFNTDLDTGGTAMAVDVGLYNSDERFTIGATTYAANQVLDADAYASAVINLTAPHLAGVEMMNEARALTAMGRTVWEDAGLASDPSKLLDIYLTMTVAPTTFAAGTIVLQGIFAAK